MAVRNEIHEIFLKVGPGQGNHHNPAGIHVCFIAYGCIHQRTKFNESYSV